MPSHTASEKRKNKMKQPKPQSKKRPRKLPPGMLHSQNVKRKKVKP